jgi:hypothetical protein
LAAAWSVHAERRDCSSAVRLLLCHSVSGGGGRREQCAGLVSRSIVASQPASA